MDGSHGQPGAKRERRRRRPRQAAARRHSIRFSLTDEEFDEIGAAAESAGLARGAYAARAALSAARGTGTASLADSPLHQALAELIRSAGVVRRIGVNLDRAVTRLAATGQRSADLVPYAAESFRKAERLDAAAEAVRRSLR
jgi:hypothetical protein